MSEIPKNKFLNSFKNIKKNNILVFLFFFVISSCLWFLMELGKIHSSQIEIVLKLENIPFNAELSDKSRQRIIVNIQGDGYSLLQEKIDNINLPITIDFNLNKRNKVIFHKNKEHDSEYFILTKDLYNNISLRLNKNITILDIKPDTIHFCTFENPVQKRVKVNNNTRFKLGSEYLISNEIIISPDSINIFGPQSIIDTINTVNTVNKDLGEIFETVSKDVELKKINDVSFSKNSVLLNIQTERFTEKTLEVAIRPINFESDYTVKLIPDKAKISFKVPLSYYYNANESDFDIVADYSKKQNGTIILNTKILNPKFTITSQDPLTVKYILNKNQETESDD